jgi:hypothetical protein
LIESTDTIFDIAKKIGMSPKEIEALQQQLSMHI